MFGTWGGSVYVDPWYYGWTRPYWGAWGPSFSFGSWGWSFGFNGWYNPWYNPWYDPWWCGHKPDCFLLAFLYGRVRNDFRFLLPGGVFPPASVLRGLPMLLPPYSAPGEPAGTRAPHPLSGGPAASRAPLPAPGGPVLSPASLGFGAHSAALPPSALRTGGVCHPLPCAPSHSALPVLPASFPHLLSCRAQCLVLPVRLPPVVHSAMTDDAWTSVCLRLPALPLSTLSA